MRSARQILSVTTAVAAAVAIVASAALVASARLMHSAGASLAEAVAAMRASGEIGTQLLEVNRESLFRTLTGADEHRRARDQAVSTLRVWVEEAWTHVSEETERVGMDAVERALTRLVETVHDEKTEALTPSRRYQVVNPLIAEALNATDRLEQANLRQAAEAQTRVERWTRLADLLGIATAGLLFAAAACQLYLLRRGLLRPLVALCGVLARYREGDRSVRAPETGLQETREMTAVFNDLADRQERRREEQLAFAAGVAHDLRNPLAALKASAWIPGDGLDALPPGQIKRRFELVRRQVDRLEALTEDLLEVSRMDAGRLELRPAVHDLAELAAESIELHACVTPDHRLELESHGPVPAVCDGARVARVLNNLVGNAVKYSPEGGLVRVRVRSDGEVALLEVEDQGPGIAPEEAGRLFEPFQRGSAHCLAPGVGMGLYVARRLVEAHGGTIGVTRSPLGGSLFRVALPAGLRHPSPRREAASAAPVPA